MGQTQSIEPRGSSDVAGAAQESDGRLVLHGQSSIEFRAQPRPAVAEPAPEHAEERSSTPTSDTPVVTPPTDRKYFDDGTLMATPPTDRKHFDGTDHMDDDDDITAYAGVVSNGARPSDEIEFAARQGK